VWNHVVLDLGPEALDLQRLHVPAFDVHHEIYHILPYGTGKCDKLTALACEHILHGPVMAVGKLHFDHAWTKHVVEDILELAGDG